jgi:hypothetical protein
MWFRKQGLAGFAVVVLLSMATQVARGQDVRVLAYGSPGVPAAMMEEAGQEAVRIFRSAGIGIVWVNCSGRGEPKQCSNVPARSDFVLHVVPKGKAADDVYGEAFLGADGRGQYADVFYGRIEAAQRDWGVSIPRLMGAVSAHEIGHLMLGLRAHSWTGIMAPVWRRESFTNLQMGALLFTREQAVRMRNQRRENEIRLEAGRKPEK